MYNEICISHKSILCTYKVNVIYFYYGFYQSIDEIISRESCAINGGRTSFFLCLPFSSFPPELNGFNGCKIVSENGRHFCSLEQ